MHLTRFSYDENRYKFHFCSEFFIHTFVMVINLKVNNPQGFALIALVTFLLLEASNWDLGKSINQ